MSHYIQVRFTFGPPKGTRLDLPFLVGVFLGVDFFGFSSAFFFFLGVGNFTAVVFFLSFGFDLGLLSVFLFFFGG